MNRKMQLLIAGAGGACGIYALTRAAQKKINTFPYGYGIKLKKAVTVGCPAAQLYRHWRDLKNLPRLFDNVLAVQSYGDGRSHWTLHVPGGMTLEWDAEITVDRENEMIGWRSLE